jgi:cellulose synthase (UDP-forming)
MTLAAFSEPLSERTRRLVRGLTIAVLCVLTGAVLVLTALPVDVGIQALFSSVALLTLLILRRWRQRRLVRILTLMVMLALGLRYMFWRTDFTLTYAGFFSFIGTILLYGAEIYGFLVFLLGLIVNLAPISRLVKPVQWDDSGLPSVDVLVPSYNEESSLLAVTLAAATQIRYPEGKLSVYLLDDGERSRSATIRIMSRPRPPRRVILNFRNSAEDSAFSTLPASAIGTPRPAI